MSVQIRIEDEAHTALRKWVRDPKRPVRLTVSQAATLAINEMLDREKPKNGRRKGK